MNCNLVFSNGKPGYHLVKLKKHIIIIWKPATKQNINVSEFYCALLQGWQALKLDMPRLALSPRWITQTANLRLETFVSYCVCSLNQEQHVVVGVG